PRERCDAEAVVESEGVFERRSRSAVEAADDVRVEESVAALRAGLAGRVVLEDDAAGRKVGMARDGSRVIRHFNDERPELRTGEVLAREPRQIAGAGGAGSRQIARDDLALGFIPALALSDRFDREDGVAGRKLGQ